MKCALTIGVDGFATIIDAASALSGRLGKEARESCYCNEGVLHGINLEARCGTVRQLKWYDAKRNQISELASGGTSKYREV
jgi:hypothetical protein